MDRIWTPRRPSRWSFQERLVLGDKVIFRPQPIHRPA